MCNQLDPDACIALLAAVVRRWWLDALYLPGECSPDNLDTLAEFMDLPAGVLKANQPPQAFYVRRFQ